MFSPQTDDLAYLKCPLHTVLKLTPVAYGRTGDNDALLTCSSINTHVLLMVTFLPSRVQSGNVLPECGSSEHTPRQTFSKSAELNCLSSTLTICVTLIDIVTYLI